MRLLLVMPPLVYARSWTRSRTAHLLHLFSWVRRHHPVWEVSVLDLDREMGSLESEPAIDRFRRAAARAIRDAAPDAIGLSCWTSLHYPATLELARIARREAPRAPVIVGGYHATALPGDFADPPGLFDYVVVGEGELALGRILDEGPERSDGEPRVVPGEPLPMEEEELLFDAYPYTEPGVFELTLSRGCPFPCEFCVEPAMQTLRGSSWRAYSWEKTERLLTDLVERRGARALSVNDALFGAQKGWRHAFWDLLGGLERPPAIWCETRVDLLEDEDYEALATLPVQADVGVDAITEESVRRMAKARSPGAYLARFYRLCHRLAERKTSVRAYLILNYPGETLDTIRQTVEAGEALAEELQRRYGESHLFLGPQRFKLFPGAPVYARREALEREHGARFVNDGWWRRPGPDLEDRAAAYVPSRDLALAGGLGAARSAARYLREACKARGSRLVRRAYDDEERGVLPHPARGFEAMLGEGPERLLALRARRAPEVATFPDGTDVHVCDGRGEESARLGEGAWDRIERLTDAGTVEGGLPGGLRQREEALGHLVALLRQGMVRLELPAHDPRGAPSSRFVLETSDGAVPLDVVDADAGLWLHALSATGFLEGQRPAAAWPGIGAMLPVPARPRIAGTAPVRDARRPGLYLSRAADERAFAELHLLARPDEAAEAASLRLLAVAPEARVLERLTTRSLLGALRPEPDRGAGSP